MRQRARLALVSVFCLAALTGISANASKKTTGEARQFLKQIPNNEKILQALNRLTFGPRPGDVQAVRAIGLKKWIDLQLHPDRIPENPVLQEKLRTFDSLNMSSADLVRNYPTPQIVRRMVAGQMPYPVDPDRKLVIQKLVER